MALESLERRELLTTATFTFNSISDGGFEVPALPAGTYQVGNQSSIWKFPYSNVSYQVAPGSSPWQFSGIAGVSANGSGFTLGDPRAPQGAQVAFIKDQGSISQAVYLDAGVYNLSLLAAQRVQYQTQPQAIAVLIDGAEVGMIVPANPVTSNNVNYTTFYAPYQSWNFTVATTGTHTVAFVGQSPSSADSTAFIDEVAITPADDAIVDGSFEEPPLPVNSYQTDAVGSAWQFSGTAGISKNGSDFSTNWVEAQNAPVGSQVAYLQDYGSMSQTLYLDAGTYELSFFAAQRAIYQSHYQQFSILVDGTQYGLVNPVNTLFGFYHTTTFTVPSGVHTVEFVGLDPAGGDNTAFIDQVTLTANGIDDASFEMPSLPAGQYVVAPTGTPWTYTATAGTASNGSSFTSGNPAAPAGTTVAFIEGQSTISQSVDLVSGSYNLSFEAAQRGNGQNMIQQIQVLVDGAQVALVTPSSSSYRLYETTNFTVTDGIHTIQFAGVNGGNSTALIDALSLVPAADQILDGGFESPILAANTYQVAPGGSPWQFTGSAGISANGSGLTSSNWNAPQGNQVGFITNNGSMSYSVYLDAETYDISFFAAQSAKPQTQIQQIEVLIDGTNVVGLITPSTTLYTLYDTLTFAVTAGPHAIQFIGQTPSGGKSTAFIDGVNLTTADGSISDGGFEAPVLAANSYQVAPNGSAWQFSGLAGQTTNLSVFTTGGANAPQGYQVAFIKDNGSMSQTVYFESGSYSISFLAAPRINNQTQPQEIQVLVDGLQVALVTPPKAGITSGSKITYTYTPYATSNFTVTTGPHVIEFLGMSPSTADSTAFIDDVTISTGGGISDGSFEQAALATHAYQVAPSGTPWQFQGVAGVSANGSSFTTGSPNAPDGYEVAFIKNTGSMSQSVYLDAGFYNISFLAAQRNKSQTQYQSLDILVDGVLVGTATPASTGYGLCETTNFTVTAGMHTITFVGVNPTGGSDNTAFIDDVQLNT